MSAAEMLKKIKQDELARVNNKFGKANQPAASQAPGDDTVLLQKTTNLLDEAERALVDVGTPSRTGDDSDNLLSSLNIQGREEASGQRDLSSDEMNEEMMDEYTPTNMVQPGWKISDDPSPSSTPSTTTDQTNDERQRAGWGARESVALQPAEEQKHNPSPSQDNISDGAIESDDGAYDSDTQD